MKTFATTPLHRAICAGDAVGLHRLLTAAESKAPIYAQELLLRLENDPLKWRKHGNQPQSVVESALWMAIAHPSPRQDEVVTVVEYWMNRWLQDPAHGWNTWSAKVHHDALLHKQHASTSSASPQFRSLPTWLTVMEGAVGHSTQQHQQSYQTLFQRLVPLMACQPTHTIGYRWLKTPTPAPACSLPSPLEVLKKFVWNYSSAASWSIAPSMMEHLWSDWVRHRLRGEALTFDALQPLLKQASHYACQELWNWVIDKADVAALLTPAHLSTLWMGQRTDCGLQWLRALIKDRGFHPIELSSSNLNKLFCQNSDATIYAYLEERWKSLLPKDEAEWITLLNRVYARDCLAPSVYTRQLWKWTVQTLERFTEFSSGQKHSALQEVNPVPVFTLAPVPAFTTSQSLHQWIGHLRAITRLTKKEKNIFLPFLEQKLSTVEHPLGIWDALYSLVCRVGLPHINLPHGSGHYMGSFQQLNTCIKLLTRVFPLSPSSAFLLAQHWKMLNASLHLDPIALPVQKMLLAHMEKIALAGEIVLMEKVGHKIRL